MYGQAIPDALDEYVKQDVAGFANRYYDVGKFIFTVSTFAILAILTLRTTFGKEYDIVLISTIFFVFCLYPSYKLTVGMDNEIDPENTISKEYELKKKWMKGHLLQWVISFVLGTVVLIGSFIYSMNNEYEDNNKVEHGLEKINKTLRSILKEIKKSTVKPKEAIISRDEFEQLNTQLSELAKNLVEHDAKTQELFIKDEIHDDRHLKNIRNKIDKACSANSK